jgi:hypothetical protein
MMRKIWFYIALLSLLLSGCGAKSNVIQKYQPEKNTKLKYSLLTTPQVEVPDVVLETMRSQIQESLSAQNLLAAKEDVKVNKENLKPYKAYFNPDGTIQAKHWYGKKNLKWRRRNGKWWIDDKDRICVKWEDQDKKKCMVIEKEGEIYRQYRIKKDGNRKHVATFKKFTDGNPDDL